MRRVNPVLLVLIQLQENGQCLGVKYFNTMEIQICSLAVLLLLFLICTAQVSYSSLPKEATDNWLG